MSIDYAYDDAPRQRALILSCYDVLRALEAEYCPEVCVTGRINVSQNNYIDGNVDAAIEKLEDARDLMSDHLWEEGWRSNMHNCPYSMTQIIANGIIDMLDGHEPRQLFKNLLQRLSEDDFEPVMQQLPSNGRPVYPLKVNDKGELYVKDRTIDLEPVPGVMQRVRNYGFAAAAIALCGVGEGAIGAAFIVHRSEEFAAVGVASLAAAIACDLLRGRHSMLRQTFTPDPS
jgi:hypothetical protein